MKITKTKEVDIVPIFQSFLSEVNLSSKENLIIALKHPDFLKTCKEFSTHQSNGQWYVGLPVKLQLGKFVIAIDTIYAKREVRVAAFEAIDSNEIRKFYGNCYELFPNKVNANSLFLLGDKPKSSNKISKLPGQQLLRIAEFLFDSHTFQNTFKELTGDWQEEYFEALFKKEVWKARWINVRYTYAFLAAMWQKSPIGDLIEFVSKLAK